MLVVFFVAIWLVGCVECTATEEEVRAHVGTTVALPCRVDTSRCGDLHSVKWYRDTSRIYVFSQVGGIARAEGDATERMSVEYAPSNTEALLKISPVEILDEASYKCEITYLEVRENCDVVQIIKLTTLVVPNSVRILGIDGVSMGNASMLGPLDEGTQVELICEANAGRPTPKVTWYNGTSPLKALYSSHEDGDGLGTGTSKLQLTLSRGDLGTKFECKVDSEALENPIVSWMTADVNVKPTKIVLDGFKGHVVQGLNVELTCEVFGARPAAEVRWFNNSDPIVDANYIQTVPIDARDGTFTTKSILTFEATRYENGNAFHCYAENSVIRDQKESSLHDINFVEVYYPPVVGVSPANITTNESVDILLLCTYISNPMKLDGVIWAKNGKNITLNDDKYEGGSVENPPLIIKNVSRDDMGDYTCICKNSVGSQESEDSVFLNVQYPPSVEVSMDPPTPVKEKDQINITLVCSVTSGNPSTLTKVRWYLGGELLKELPDCNYTSNEDGELEGSGGQFCGIDPSIISLENVVQSMAGNYTCQGMSIAGWGPESEPVELVVYYPPSPANLRFTPSRVIKTASVTLDCSVNNPGRPDNITYLWYRGTYQVPDVTTSNWTISPVLLETKSNFTCIASNEGGQSENATVFINVSAPPAFIQNLSPYQGVLMTSKNISLTCRVECSPLCGITWYKDGHQLHLNNNPLYYVRSSNYPPDLRKNDFESVESTLVWNMTAWPDEMLDRTAPNSNYTCQSSANGIGPGVNSTIEIAVDYPPENLTVSNRVVSVVENHKPEKVVCNGKGHPTLSYIWRRDDSHEPLSKSHILNLGAVPRSASGKYICEATNRHGTESTNVYLNVQYAPGCSIETIEYEGVSALECTAHANPQDVTFTWKIKGENDTIEGSSLVQKGSKGYLKLDSSVDSFRTYQCFVNNSVGVSSPCERGVTAYQEQSSQIGIPGVAPWWRQFTNENLLIIIAIIVGIIIFVIIICIIIILVCRRKRANNKYTNAVEMEEREKPDGQSPDTSATMPLKPGALIQANKLHSLNINPMSLTKGFKTTSDSYKQERKAPLCKRNKNKVYARLERFKELLGFRESDSLPFGVYRGSTGVVTFKKFKNPSSPNPADAAVASRKRKKPGLSPNPSSTADKGGLGAAPPGGGSADPLTDPDKGFYENLPFHGMQNPPNKPISVISPMIQHNSRIHPFSSTKSLVSNRAGSNTINNRIRRNQTFHGFQDYPVYPQQFWPIQFSNPNIQFVPSIFYNLPRNFCQQTGSYTVGAIRTNPQVNPLNYYNRVQSFNNIPFHVNQHITNPFHQRVVGRNEYKLDIRRTASGINLSTDHITNETSNTSTKNKQSSTGKTECSSKSKSNNKRFNSLEIKKHKCYSPTFYSMRCKKHAKRRPIIYTVPKCKTEQTEYQDLTDSIQFLEEQSPNLHNIPKPAPRCSKHKLKTETIYANVSDSIKSKQEEISFNSPKNNSNNSTGEMNSPNSTNTSSKFEPVVSEMIPKTSPKSDNKNMETVKITPEKIANSSNENSNDLPKVRSPITKDFNKSLKVTPTLKVSPNFIKPKTESPKGALYMQLQAKMKASAQKSINETPLTLNSSTLVQKALSQTSLNRSNTSLDKLDQNPLNVTASPVSKLSLENQNEKPNLEDSFSPNTTPKRIKIDDKISTNNAETAKENPIPEMPLLETQHKWNSFNSTNNQPYRTEFSDLDYADIDYRSYGPINYKAASIYAAMKRKNKNDDKEYDDLL